MNIRRLNKAGVDRFRDFLREARDSNSEIEPPFDILELPTTSSGLNVSISIGSIPQIDTKLGMAQYLNQILEPLGQDDMFSHTGMWSWLGLYFFDTICPANSSGQRRIGREWYYSFQPDHELPNYQTYYRHLLYTPYQIYRMYNGEAGKVLLSGRVSAGGEMTEQIASRLEFISCRPILESLDYLYFQEGDGVQRIKRGATNYTRDGNLRRFISFIQQIDTTYDLYGISSDKIIELLPAEFNEWL